MKKMLVALLLLPGCAPSGQDNQASPVANDSATAGAGTGSVGESLTGLYEGGTGERENQLCMVGEGKGSARFGLVVWGANLNSCSGTGTATRSGGGIKLAMAGDSECTITASVTGGTITLPATIPEGCAYYCGARARLGGVAFAPKGTTRASALEAKDLVGESLCVGR